MSSCGRVRDLPRDGESPGPASRCGREAMAKAGDGAGERAASVAASDAHYHGDVRSGREVWWMGRVVSCRVVACRNCWCLVSISQACIACACQEQGFVLVPRHSPSPLSVNRSLLHAQEQ
jgi:hypothetical protein